MFSAKRQAQASFRARFGTCVLCAILGSSLVVCSAFGAVTRQEFDSGVTSAMSRLTKEASSREGSALVAELVQQEYGTPVEEIRWAREHDLSWGAIVAFAYVRATTGLSFAELEKDAPTSNLWEYIDKSGMSADKMVHSLAQFLKRVQEERNTRIFERMRVNRRVLRMPDLGSGFGLLQEALDFRRLEPARPTKVHTVGSSDLLKGEK